ncbi:MAG: DUF4331 family protein [Rhodothermales bacterium]
MKRITRYLFMSVLVAIAAIGLMRPDFGDASSHREAPLISNDPLADNTDLYAFRSPDDPSTVTIIANYIPLQLPEGGPNYNTFGEHIRYEIHIKNKTSVGALGSAKDDITYRFTFQQENEDPTTFFNIRLGKQNLKTTYTVEKSTDGGASFMTILDDGIVPPNNIGPRSIEGAAGLNADYESLVNDAIMTASTGEVVFAGPRDDAFFVDLGGVFDLGQTRGQYGMDPSNSNNARDAVAGFNVHTISLQIPIEYLQKDGYGPDEADNILDPNYVIGVWASASRPQITTLSPEGDKPTYSGPWVQVSRLGMPLTNEAVIPIGEKDRWNATSPYSEAEQSFIAYFANPELGLYMDDTQFGSAVPALAALRMPSRSYPALGDIDGDGMPGLNFRNGKDGAFEVTKIDPPLDLSGTAFAVPLAGGLVGEGQPRLVDLYPIFYFGVPNAIPYQLATGKTGGPLSAGKPFIHNFLPVTQDAEGTLYGGDMLRLNMATPTTERSGEEFDLYARQGLVRTAVLGLTAAPYNTSADVEFIPHMDGFPNGRRLEDDVTTIALQAVGGLVLAAVGLPFDDATASDYSDLASEMLVGALNYTAGPVANDVRLLDVFPYQASPHRGFDYVKQLTALDPMNLPVSVEGLGVGVPSAFMLDQNYPNPFNPSTTISYEVTRPGNVAIRVYDVQGRLVSTLVNREHGTGNHQLDWDASSLPSGTYFYRLEADGKSIQTKQAILVK